jgi:hypothetical protein
MFDKTMSPIEERFIRRNVPMGNFHPSPIIRRPLQTNLLFGRQIWKKRAVALVLMTLKTGF